MNARLSCSEVAKSHSINESVVNQIVTFATTDTHATFSLYLILTKQTFNITD